MKLSYYTKIAKSILEADEEKEKSVLFGNIDTAIDGGNGLPEAIASLPWMVEYKSASVHDAYAAARKTMASSKVKINVMPPFANPQNAQEAKNIEDILTYNFWLSDRKTSKGIMDRISEFATRYLAFGIEIIDNYFQTKGDSSARAKAIRRSGRFTWKFHDRRTIHPRFSDSIMEDVLIARIVTVQDLIEKFGEEDTKEISIKEIIDDAKSESKKNKVDYLETTGTLFTWWDYDNRVEWFSMNGDNIDTSGGDDAYQIINVKNKIGFIPIVCVEKDDPILKAVVDTDQLDNLNIMLSMRYALIAATVAQARTWSKTASGEGVPVDHSNPAAQVQMKLNEDFGVTQPAQTDPNIDKIIAASQSDIASATSVSRIISSMDSMAGNTPYSTISALMQSALQSLVDIRTLIERGIEQALCIEMYWSKYTKEPLNGQRMKKVGLYDDTKMLGAMLTLDPQQSDDWPDKWIVTVQLRPNSPTDRQERLNFAINAQEKLLLSRESAFDIAGIDDDPEVSLMEWADTQMKVAKVQADIKRILNQPDIEMQTQVAQAQQAAAQLPQGQEPTPNPNGSMGQTPATGGTPDAMNDPTATREAITGQSSQMTSGA